MGTDRTDRTEGREGGKEAPHQQNLQGNDGDEVPIEISMLFCR